MIFVLAFGTVRDVVPSMRNGVTYRTWRWKLGPFLLVVGRALALGAGS